LKSEEITIGGIGIAIAAYVLYTVSSYPQVKGNDVGVGFFPKMLAILLIILCACMIFHAVRGTSPHKDVQVNLITPGTKRAAVALLICALYCIFFKLLGFVIDTALFMFSMMFLLKSRNWMQMTLVSLGVSIGVYVLFGYVLNTNLPAGLLAGLL